MKRKPRLNNLQLGYQRNDLTYEAVITDLYLVGVLPRDTAETLIGRQISDTVKLPDGSKASE